MTGKFARGRDGTGIPKQDPDTVDNIFNVDPSHYLRNIRQFDQEFSWIPVGNIQMQPQQKRELQLLSSE
jgi:hypothetical protein